MGLSGKDSLQVVPLFILLDSVVQALKNFMLLFEHRSGHIVPREGSSVEH